MLCATLKYADKKTISHASKKADLIELRLDKYEPKNLESLRQLCARPVIFKLQEADFDKLKLLPDYVDLPHTVPPQLFEEIGKRFPQVKRICSYHDYEKTGDLESIFSKLRCYPAEIYKIATMAENSSDALRMLLLVKKYRCLGICMGESGTVTRILASCFGAPWTYAPLSEDQQTAPGQLLLTELENIYNFYAHSTSTAIYGLIGDPVNKSPSHVMHNFAFKKLKVDAVYVKMRVPKEELQKCFSLCRTLGFKGLSVTMPLKEAITCYLDQAELSAVNTVGFREEGVYGWNTDGPAALDALEKRGRVGGKKIVLLGAGGAAKGIAMEAKKRKAQLVILNRTFSRAQKLAQEVGASAFPLGEFRSVALSGYDILINCTSVGMGEDPRLAVAADDLLEKKLVLEIITRPRVTAFVAAARLKGCEVVEGMEMFIQQAVGQYCHWFKERISDA